MYLFDKPHKYSTRKSRPELDSDFHKFTNGWNLLLYAHTKRDHKSYGSAARLYGSWIYNYLCNQGLSHLHGELYSIQHYVIQFQLKVALNTITLTLGSKHSIEIATENIIICYSVYNIYYTDAACTLPAAIQNTQWNDETRSLLLTFGTFTMAGWPVNARGHVLADYNCISNTDNVYVLK